MRTQSEPPGPSIDGGDQQSFHSSPTISAVTAISGRSSLGMGLQYKGAWCTPPRIFMDHQDDIIPHLEPGRLPSTVDLDTVHPFDKGKKIPQRPVRISAWKLAKLDSNEAVKAGAKARASSSSVLRPLGTKHQNYDVDYLSSSNVSGRNSPTSTNQGFRGRNARSASESSYPPSRTSREDIKSISNLSSPLPPNLALSPLEQRSSNADHFYPMYQSSENQSPWSAKVNDGNETVLSDNVAQVPMRRNNLGVAENTRPSVYWDQEAGRFVTAATRNVNSSSSQVPGTELTYTGQSIFFGGPLVNERFSGGTRSASSGSERSSAASYYQQGGSQEGWPASRFCPK